MVEANSDCVVNVHGFSESSRVSLGGHLGETAMPRRPSVSRHLRSIKRALADIEKVFAAVAKRVRKAERVAVLAANSERRKMTITPKRRAQLKLQGAYMGFMRQLPARRKAKVKAIKERRGLEAAIRAARRIAKSSC
jgi:hypothetical protein